MATNKLVYFFEYKLYSLESISPCDIEPVPGNDSSPENFLKSELASQLAMTNAVIEARRCIMESNQMKIFANSPASFTSRA